MRLDSNDAMTMMMATTTTTTPRTTTTMTSCVHKIVSETAMGWTVYLTVAYWFLFGPFDIQYASGKSCKGDLSSVGTGHHLDRSVHSQLADSQAVHRSCLFVGVQRSLETSVVLQTPSSSIDVGFNVRIFASCTRCLRKITRNSIWLRRIKHLKSW